MIQSKFIWRFGDFTGEFKQPFFISKPASAPVGFSCRVNSYLRQAQSGAPHQEYSSKPLKRSIVERIFVFKR